MDLVKKFFPVSTRSSELVGLIISLVIYIVLPTVFGWVVSLLSGIPLIGWLLGVIAGLIGLYCFIGIIISVLIFFKVIK
ncbi:MAG: hypothetical protein E7559_07835 [Ruminococcaceae bacterium]|nr:hypothetical protein [Oscillospiraceae bacterium]